MFVVFGRVEIAIADQVVHLGTVDMRCQYMSLCNVQIPHSPYVLGTVALYTSNNCFNFNSVIFILCSKVVNDLHNHALKWLLESTEFTISALNPSHFTLSTRTILER
jgi:hypothetical protein